MNATTQNFNYLKSLQAKMINKEVMTPKENEQLLYAMTNGFSYASKPNNFKNTHTRNTKHTQGNWHTNEGQIYPQETGKTLALIPYFDKDNEEMEANSKLIATAPELLKALQNLFEDVQYSIKDIPLGAIGQRQINAAKEAINKATL